MFSHLTFIRRGERRAGTLPVLPSRSPIDTLTGGETLLMIRAPFAPPQPFIDGHVDWSVASLVLVSVLGGHTSAPNSHQYPNQSSCLDRFAFEHPFFDRCRQPYANGADDRQNRLDRRFALAAKWRLYLICGPSVR